MAKRQVAVATLVCQGRVLLRDGTQYGAICGAQFSGHPGPSNVDHDLAYTARAAGWAVGTRADGTPDALCPRCRAPLASLVRDCDDLERSVRRGD